MGFEDLAALLGGWEGFEVVAVEKQEIRGRQPVPEMVFTLRAVPDHPKRCSRCGEIVEEVHDTTERRVRDLSVFDYDTWIVFPRARLECPRCGPTVEAVPWLDKHQRMTTRLAEKIARLTGVMPIKHVAAECRLGWDVVKQVHCRALARQLGPITRASLAGVRLLAIDEFAIQKGHRLCHRGCGAGHQARAVGRAGP